LKSIEQDADHSCNTYDEIYDQVEDNFAIIDDFHLLDDFPIILPFKSFPWVMENCHVLLSPHPANLDDVTLLVAGTGPGLNHVNWRFPVKPRLYAQNHQHCRTKPRRLIGKRVVDHGDGAF
jgi:hypothetical protein